MDGWLGSGLGALRTVCNPSTTQWKQLAWRGPSWLSKGATKKQRRAAKSGTNCTLADGDGVHGVAFLRRMPAVRTVSQECPKTISKSFATLSKQSHPTEKATQYIVNNPEKSWEVFAATSTELQDELNARALVDTLPRFALRPAAFDAGRYATFESFLHDMGLVPAINPVGKIAMDVTATK